MGQPKATITIPSPTQRRASRSASAACRIRAIGRGGRQNVVRTRSVSEKAAVVDRSVKRFGLVPYVEGNASPRPHSVSRGDGSAKVQPQTSALVQQFPACDFRPENTLVLISHFANSLRIMLSRIPYLTTWANGVARHGTCSR